MRDGEGRNRPTHHILDRRWRSPRGWIIGVIVAGIGVGGLLGIASVPEQEGASAARTESGSSPASTTTVEWAHEQGVTSDPHAALAALETLAVKGRAPKTGYHRDRFGGEWIDVDGNGCDTRKDVLARDLAGVVRDGCAIVGGTLVDPYTGATIEFDRGDPAAIQIDHVVALSDAWQKGAQALTGAARIAFANDPVNLLAVSAEANNQKRDGDAATWLPKQKSFRCTYIALQVEVKRKYQLWVTTAERDAMRSVLEECPPAAVGNGGDPTPVSTLATVPPSTTAIAGPYPNCAAARADGAAPLYRGDPGYGPHLDGDGNGIACE